MEMSLSEDVLRSSTVYTVELIPEDEGEKEILKKLQELEGALTPPPKVSSKGIVLHFIK